MTLRREIRRRLDALPDLFAAVEDGLAAAGVAPAERRVLRRKLDLVAEELFVNQLQHGRGDGATMLLEIAVAGGGVTLKLTDRGAVPFAPATAPAPDPDRDPPGGLGLHFILSLSDNVTWDHDGHDLTVTVFKRFAEA